jgi:MinD-like ATPase involved in chromosome partitioning or flagellar assembly
MIPPDVVLFTWLDVEEVLHRIQSEGSWPPWVQSTRAYWDSLEVTVDTGKQIEANQWLYRCFEPRISKAVDESTATLSIILESSGQVKRLLPVSIIESDEQRPKQGFIPSFSRRPILQHPAESIAHPKRMPAGHPPVVAFHSFKGGVGRTLHAISFALAMSDKGKRVLLIDGDTEAPGISWLLQKRLPTLPFSFADLLALAHEDPSESNDIAIRIAADQLQSSHLDNIFALPAFRSMQRFTTLDIRPEHLLKGASDPFILTSLLGRLGAWLQVDAVVMDLRAGLSELSSGLLLDPRVYRVFVSTLASQSLFGTEKVLGLVGRLAPSIEEDHPLPALILNQIPSDALESDAVGSAHRRLLESAEAFVSHYSDPDEHLKDIPVLQSAFNAGLLVLSGGWEDACLQIRRCGLTETVKPLLSWIPSYLTSNEQTVQPDLTRKRNSLRQQAVMLQYAERGEGEDFLPISPLKRLVSDHRVSVPISVMVGAKGAGKTYTFLQLARRKSWRAFGQGAGYKDVNSDALIAPLLESANLFGTAKDIADAARKATIKDLHFGDACDYTVLTDYIRDSIADHVHAGKWREIWLDAIAWSLGYKVREIGAGLDLSDALSAKGKRVIVLVDGLEDLFQSFSSKEAEQIALRSLLQEVPDWLRQQPQRSIGLLVFVRQDMLVSAVRQNAPQLVAKYEPYALKWSDLEALRLVTWIAVKADAIRSIDAEGLQQLSEAELKEELVPVWGRKLGLDHSREGRSAEWVIAALSDLRGQVQARDIVRLIYMSAAKSSGDERWKDRILTPTAIRDSLPECSKEKISEIEKENEPLAKIFSRLRRLSPDAKQIPFTSEQVQLKAEEIKLLEDNGVVVQEASEYYMPEIFRLGLAFSYKRGARPRVLSLARRTVNPE